MKLIYFIYLQITTCRLIKHFTVIYADANKQFLTLNLIFFCREKISLSGTPISLPKIADLPIWAQENITCMHDPLIMGLPCCRITIPLNWFQSTNQKQLLLTLATMQLYMTTGWQMYEVHEVVNMNSSLRLSLGDRATATQTTDVRDSLHT